jgi:thymidylate synthase
MILVHSSYKNAIKAVEAEFLNGVRKVHSKHWQGVDISNKPEMATFEKLHVSFAVRMNGYEHDLEAAASHIEPNLPWADDHFEERVCGQPINPGVQWKKWPYGQHAAKFLDENGKFNHNYMERYWPKQAGAVLGPTETAEQYAEEVNLFPPNFNYAMRATSPDQHRGIKYEYGDLSDVVTLLANDPYTRQAYLPVWFPEDTGGGDKRAPCTLGYHFIMRDNMLDITYYIRSCDMRRHMRDDIYLTHRLAVWMHKECMKFDPRWRDVELGQFNMHITSLHIFANDWQAMFPEYARPT